MEIDHENEAITASVTCSVGGWRMIKQEVSELRWLQGESCGEGTGASGH